MVRLTAAPGGVAVPGSPAASRPGADVDVAVTMPMAAEPGERHRH